MDNADSPVLGIAIASLILFGFLDLVQRAGPAYGQSSGPSIPMRACGLLAGAAGALLVVTQYGSNLYMIAAMPYCVLFVVMLLAFGFFGLPRPRRRGPAITPAEQLGISEDAIAELEAQPRLQWKPLFCYGVLASVGAGILMVCTGHWPLDSRKLKAEATYPDSAAVGEEFKVAVDLVNPGEREVPVEGVCLTPSIQSEHDSILAGARMTRIDPLLASNAAEGSPCGHISGYTVRSRETKRLTFYLEGTRPGDFSTDIVFYLEDSTTVVKDLLITLTPSGAQGEYTETSGEDSADRAAVFHAIR